MDWELVVRTESLKECRLAKCDRPVLFRVEETTLGTVYAPTCYRRCHVIPLHPPVHVFESVAPPVASGLALRSQVGAASAVLRDHSDHVQHTGCSSDREVMKRIATEPRLWQSFDCIPDGLSFLDKVWRFDRSHAARCKKHSPPSLGDAVVGRVEDFDPTFYPARSNSPWTRVSLESLARAGTFSIKTVLGLIARQSSGIRNTKLVLVVVDDA